MITVPVELEDRRYEVLIGPRALHELSSVLPEGARRAVVVTQENIGVDVDPGIDHQVVNVEDGEGAKTLRTVEDLCRGFSAFGLSRYDVVVAVGGGVVTDIAGFAAATYHRGIAYVNVATSLLAQVDAAVGGKTGANLPEGKNLVGAFWQPHAVLCDTDTLASLPPREVASGRGEMAKYAFLGDDPPGTGLLDLPLDEQVAECVSLKASVVAGDEREGGSGRRMTLNYGHTLAHALEASVFGTGNLLHGEAVAVGLVFAAELAHRLGRIDQERVLLHREVISGFDLSGDLPPGTSATELVALMGRDKKAHHDLTFVLDGPRGVETVRGVPIDAVLATLAEMGSRP